MPGVDFRALRAGIAIGEVLSLLNFDARAGFGEQVRGPCPLHDSAETSRAFSVNLAKHAFQCFKCGARGNQLDLWAAATKQSLYEAALDLCRRVNRDVPWLATRTEKRNP
jgi:DNA primase